MVAQGRRYVCSQCTHSIEAWSDGNPYYIDESGEKQHAHHPDHEALDKCIGNDSPHLCLTCGAEFMVDSRSPAKTCPACGARKIADTYEVDGRPCPHCKSGKYAVDPRFDAIS